MSSEAESRVLLAHPAGNQFVRHLALTLQRAGWLTEFCTCIDWRPGRVLSALLPRALSTELGRRNFSGTLVVPVASHGGREWARLMAGRAGLTALTRHETGVFSVDAVWRDFDAWIARRMRRRGGMGTIYAYEDAAEASFVAAGELGWRKVYDLPIAYWETSHRLLAEEAERRPEWAVTLEAPRNSPAKLERKTRELAMADIVVCPSRFVADSLPAAGCQGKRVVVAPFGSPPPGPAPRPRAAGAKLRVLFAGAMSQRKGLADLFAAMRRLKRTDVELVVLGSPVATMEFYRREFRDFVYEKPRAHAGVLALMETCDVLCLPSIVEGRALVVQEAMSQGLPAIVTANTGTADVVKNGHNGFVVPLRAPEAIAEKIAWLADRREAVPELGRAAQAAAARVTWERYGEIIQDALSGRR